MNEDPFRLNPEHQLIVAVTVIFLTASVQLIVFYANSVYVYQTMGIATLVIYGAAAFCYVLFPWVIAHIDDIRHARVIKTSLLGFCFWIGAEEVLHASHHYQTPEIATAIASVFATPTQINMGARIVVVAVTLLMIELLSHFQHHGITLLRSAQKRRARKHR